MTAPADLSRGRGDTVRALRSFALVGGVGFAIEAVLLTGLVQLAGWALWHARIPSFVTAVLVTWALNRQRTFRGRGMQRRSLEAFFYVGIQACGAVVNLAIFGVCLWYWPQLRAIAVIPLAIGAIGGFVFNFAISDVFLYARCRAERHV